MAIKPLEFDFQESRWQDLYLHLKNKGYDVYAPAQKVGECTEPYLVVKNDGSYQHANFSSDRDMYAIYCYVPKLRYSELEPLVQRVKRDMRELYPMFQVYGQQLASFYDDEVKAHYISIEYENYKKVLFM
jgi:hypothetical protein